MHVVLQGENGKGTVHTATTAPAVTPPVAAAAATTSAGPLAQAAATAATAATAAATAATAPTAPTAPTSTGPLGQAAEPRQGPAVTCGGKIKWKTNTCGIEYALNDHDYSRACHMHELEKLQKNALKKVHVDVVHPPSVPSDEPNDSSEGDGELPPIVDHRSLAVLSLDGDINSDGSNSPTTAYT